MNAIVDTHDNNFLVHIRNISTLLVLKDTVVYLLVDETIFLL